MREKNAGMKVGFKSFISRNYKQSATSIFHDLFIYFDLFVAVFWNMI